MGVGRSAIREALKALEVLGMVDIRPGQGSYISSSEENFFAIPLSWSLFLNSHQIENILAIRNLLEVKAAELAAECKDPEKLERLYTAFHNLHEAYTKRDCENFLEKDLEFHLCIAECSENNVIYSMIQTIRNLMRRVSKSGMSDVEQLMAIQKEHQQVYGLIIARSGKGAAAAMEEHLKKAAQRYNYQ